MLKSENLKSTIKNAAIFLSLLILFVVGLTIVFLPSNSQVINHAETASHMFASEGTYPRYNSEDVGSQLDNFTDLLMIRTTKRSSINPVFSAMDMGGYARYWHGYMIWLRPMLGIMSMGSIRQVYAVFISLLIGICLYLISKRLDLLVVLSFSAALMFQRLFSVLISMQFANILIVTILATIYVLLMSDEKFKIWSPTTCFFIIGCITNFVDLLTFPLISFGIPLIVVLYRREMLGVESTSILGNIWFSIKSGLSWLIGYILTWGSKWIIASSILRRNVVREALDAILFRTQGVGEGLKYETSRIDAIRLNLDLEFIPANKLFFFAAITVGIIAIIVISIKKRRIDLPYLYLGQLLLLSLLPFAWYLILANHSEIHFWFTYRQQLVTVFAVFMMLSLCIRKIMLEANYTKNSLM